MKQFNKNLLRVFYILVIGAMLALPALAADLAGSMSVSPAPEQEAQEWVSEDGSVSSDRLEAGTFVDRTVGAYGLSLIKKF